MTEKGEDKSLKSDVALKEEKILEFWKDNQIFKKTLKKEAPKGEFVFYEGPPTANGKPGIHHIEARAFKDIIPRYKTMQGFHVRRRGGWDTHGLPVELQVEKQLGLKSKKEIETYGIEAFNKKCKESVWEYVDLWGKFTDRIGYWVDQENPYVTYDNSYIESVWNILKTVHDKKLLYKDYKVLPWCPRCGTALSSHELAQGYQDDKDLSVTAKFKIKGVENGYFLAWTTTPWTLPGNVALAVGKDIIYVEAKVGNEILVLAKDRLSIITEPYEIVAEHKGSEMLGMEYEPLYNFLSEKFKDKDSEAFAKSYKVYEADFVNTEDGTGIVHTAVMYGQDDFVLGTKIGLPKFHLVVENGHFLSGMDFLSDRFVKPARPDDSGRSGGDEDVAVDIIKDLAKRGLLFKKEKYEHSYPHCWRCNTPLIYYARDSWYIGMSKLREDLIKENENINWEPSYIKEGRFGEWLREIKDWAISRERYWGTPLPIWQNKDGDFRVVGSLEEFKKLSKKSGNKYFVMRHGETEGNVKKVWNIDSNNPDPLTELGKKSIKENAKVLAKEKIDIIIVSPFVRTQETANLVAESLNLSKENILIDSRAGEWNVGKEFDQKSVKDFFAVRNNSTDRYHFKTDSGEAYSDVVVRSGDFIYDLERKYSGKNILIISHGAVTRALSLISDGFSQKGLDKHTLEFKNFSNAEIRQIDFAPLPHNENYELDLHRPFIDTVELLDENGGSLTRVKEVLDVWFDSGAMPFAQDHYPFTTKDVLYPADYISEAIDQTRGWFYTLHAIGVLMGRGNAYKNVICLGHILDARGKKMSKSVGNVVDPWEMMDKYGVDAIRFWMYSVNQPGDSKNFDEKTVDEIVKKVFNPLENILTFYDLYKDDTVKPGDKSKNILDRWVIARLNELISSGTKSLDTYKIFEATRSIKDFANDFSTWYLRRSRERFKGGDEKDKKEALATTKFVFMELLKYMAPFTPFFTESSYQKLRSSSDPESVHICSWPKTGKIDSELLEQMTKVREVVSKALELRQKAGHKVRQPLASLKLKVESKKFESEYLEIIKDEINVKEIIFDENIKEDLELDTKLTEELKEEGMVRDIIRSIQDWRKEKNLKHGEIVQYPVPEGSREFFAKHSKEIKKITNVQF